MVNASGDIVIVPTFLETSVLKGGEWLVRGCPQRLQHCIVVLLYYLRTLYLLPEEQHQERCRVLQQTGAGQAGAGQAAWQLGGRQERRPRPLARAYTSLLNVRLAAPAPPCAAGVVGDHLLERYRAAFAALLKAQFTDKALPGGRAGVEALAGQVGGGLGGVRALSQTCRFCEAL